MKKIKEKDIAAMCGVSVSTVSKAMNGYPREVSDAKRTLIRETAARMGYDMKARRTRERMRRSGGKQIGILVQDWAMLQDDQKVLSRMMDGIMDVGYEHRADVVLLNRTYRGISDAAHTLWRAVDGIVAVCGADPLQDSQFMGAMRIDEIPIVTVNYAFDSHVCVRMDMLQGMRLLLRWMRAQGRRFPALIGNPDAGTGEDVLRAFERAVREEQMTAVRMDGPVNVPADLRRLLSLPQPPDCLICENGRVANKIDFRLREGVEQEVLIGALGGSVAQSADISVVYDGYAIGRKAAEELISLMPGKCGEELDFLQMPVYEYLISGSLYGSDGKQMERQESISQIRMRESQPITVPASELAGNTQEEPVPGTQEGPGELSHETQSGSQAKDLESGQVIPQEGGMKEKKRRRRRRKMSRAACPVREEGGEAQAVAGRE